ncbi:MAG: hypothetical protein Q8K78_10545 [Planctomycetaceae bacterium]|nr:hypothetical protein [Planctomycetaceae bacterium]
MSKLPRGLLDLPEFRDLQDHGNELQRQYNGLLTQIDELQTALASAPRGANRIRAKAMGLVHGSTNTAIAEAVELQADLSSAQEQAEILEEAASLQQQIIRDRVPQLCIEIRAGLLSEHQSLGRRVAKAMRELRDALAAEQEFRDELERGGVSHGQPWASVAVPWAQRDRIDYFLSELPAAYKGDK